MADLRASFEADFASFYDACKQAVVELKSFETGASQVEDKLDRMSNRFSGQKVIQDAQLMTEAIERLGGVSTLTEAELARVGRVANEAVEKMQALGMDVPKGMQDLADATKNVGGATESTSVSVGNLAASYITAEAAIKLVETAYDALVSSIEAVVRSASEAEEADAALLAALRAQGTAVPSVVDAYDRYAQALQATTKYSDDAVKAAEAVLVQIGGVMPKDMERAIQVTANLATVLKTDLSSAALQVAKAAEGQTAALTKAGVIIHGTAEGAADFTDVLAQLETQLHGNAEAAGDTFAGNLAKLANAWDNVLEATGRVIVNNQTWHDAIVGITAIVTENTSELSDNAAANNLVSDAVILLVKGFALAVDGVDFFQKEIRDTRVILDVLAISIGYVYEGLQKIELATQKPLAWAGSEEAAKRVEEASAALEEASAKIDRFKADMDAAKATSAEWSANLAALHTQLDDLGVALAENRGQTRGLTADATENNDVWTMITENRKANAAAEEEAAKAAKVHAAAVAELESVSIDFHATIAALNPELVEVVEHYLAAGVSADTLGKAFNLTAAQVAALSKALQEQTQQLKEAEAYQATLAKLHAELTAAETAQDADALQARITNELEWGKVQKAVLDKAHQDTLETYGLIDKIVDQSIDNMTKNALAKSKLTEAYYADAAAKAHAAEEFALAHMEEYTAQGLQALHDATLKADDDLLHWQDRANATLTGVETAAHGAAKAVDIVNQAFNTLTGQINDLTAIHGSVPGGGTFDPNAPAPDQIPGSIPRGFNYSAWLLNQIYAPPRAMGGPVAAGQSYIVGERGPELLVAGAGGGTIVPNGGGGGPAAPTVVIHAGAFVFNTPIMDTPQAMDKIVRMVGDAFVAKATRTGVRF